MEPKVISRTKSSTHTREPGRIYQAIVTSTREDGRVFVKIPTLSVNVGPILPLNTSPSKRLSVDDTVACAFTDSYNSSLVIFGSATQVADDFSISRYATSIDRDAQIPSPQEGRTVYILDSDELQIYNGTSWITVIDTGASENLSIQTLNVSGTSTLSASTSIGAVSSTELSYLDGVTSAIQGQINSKAPSASPTFTGVVTLPSSTSIGVISSTELSYLYGVTSAIQGQIDSKAPSASPTFTGVVTLPSSTSIGDISSTELSYLDGVSSNIQTQLDAKVPFTQTIRSVTSSSDIPTNSDNGKIVLIDTSSGAVTITINGSLGLSAGQQINFVWQGAATSVTFSASGLTGGSLSGTPGTKLRTRYSAASLLCTASNTYILIGDLAA